MAYRLPHESWFHQWRLKMPIQGARIQNACQTSEMGGAKPTLISVPPARLRFRRKHVCVSQNLEWILELVRARCIVMATALSLPFLAHRLSRVLTRSKAAGSTWVVGHMSGSIFTGGVSPLSVPDLRESRPSRSGEDRGYGGRQSSRVLPSTGLIPPRTVKEIV